MSSPVTQWREWEESFPKLVTFYIQKGREDSKWEEVGEWEVGSIGELTRITQLVQDMTGNSRVKGIDSITGGEDITLYKR